MKLTIKYDIESQTNYLCFLAKHIQSGTYQKAGLPIFPYAAKTSSVYFPDLGYSKEFWKLIKKSKGLHLTITRDSKLLALAKSLLNNPINTGSFETKKQEIELYWLSNYQNFFDIAQNLFGKDFTKEISEIEILLTPIGTSGSFKNEGTKVVMTVRADLPHDVIFQTLLNALIRRKLDHLTETGTARFADRQKYLEFLLKHTAFSKIVSIRTESVSEKLLSDSHKYLAKLGFPHTQVLEFKSEKLFVNNTSSNHLFTPSETRFLKTLYSHAGELVSFDKLSDAIWKEASDEKFSLYSLAKFVEKIRKKLEDLGIQKEIIKTIRGKGYILN